MSELAYVVTATFLRISIGLLLLQIFANQGAAVRIVIICTLAFTTICTFTFFIVFLLQCRPVSYWWKQIARTATGHCINLRVVNYLISGEVAICDLILAFLPIAFISRMEAMALRTKIYVCSLLGMGGIICIAVILRTWFIAVLVKHQKKDFTYYSTNVVLCSTIECGLGIMCANIATARPLLSKLKCVKRKARATGFGDHEKNSTPTSRLSAFVCEISP